jgi:G3E family GTPase
MDFHPSWVGVAAWWNLLVHHHGSKLLRCKGLLHLNEIKPYVLVQGVGKVFHSPTHLAAWPDADPRGRIVCIGSGLDPKWLQDSLRALHITEPSSRPQSLEELNHCF